MELELDSKNRSMIVDKFPDRTIQIETDDHLYFGGTSYLGIATNEEFQHLLMNSFKKWGTAYGSSRNSNIKLSIYKNFEFEFARFIGSEYSMAISSGMLAGKFVIHYLSKFIKSFYHFPKAHPAICSDNSLPLFIDNQIHPNLKNHENEEVVISIDAIVSSEVTPTSVDFLNLISPEKKITFIIDESHSLGIVGKKGMGIYNTINHKLISRKILVTSMAKAFGLSFGVIASDFELIKNLQEEPVFITASATNPAFLETFLKAQKLYELQLKKLQINLNLIFSGLESNSKLVYDTKYPVIYSNDDLIFSTLVKNKIIISRFKYPTYKGYFNRIVINSNHSNKDLNKLISILNLKNEK